MLSRVQREFSTRRGPLPSTILPPRPVGPLHPASRRGPIRRPARGLPRLAGIILTMVCGFQILQEVTSPASFSKFTELLQSFKVRCGSSMYILELNEFLKETNTC